MAMESNQALVLHPNLKLTVEKVPVQVPKPNEVLIKIHSTGICGTDLHMWSHGGAGDFKVTKPMILGHECSGLVVKIGSEVKKLQIGDRVAIEPAIPCLNCAFCIGGRYNLCRDLDGRGYPNDGCCRTYYAHPELFCFKLPHNVSFEEGALVEPLAVACHTCKRAQVTAGQTVLICGSGPIGLLCLLVAKARGATTIIISDILQIRLDVAMKLGATHTILVSKNTTLHSKVSEILEGELPEVTIDCHGSAETVEAAILATRPGGVVTIVGLGGERANISLPDVVFRELDIRGVSRYFDSYPSAIQLLASGAVDVRPLITKRFALKDVVKAFETAFDAKSGSVKILIQE